ncbi:hypothetical protein ACIGMX_44740 [Streptomyces aquilus]|uniref:Uncharacterized protein n=1 Tax=Streptomyces aquilus TaxID=2548456 RepID=A0A3Q9C580_9ACTN|nr:hypothetical protein [Streptomyces aquilus]AZP20802.1 hypothetical protein EJC51_34890 [Streptomyces aquilus]
MGRPITRWGVAVTLGAVWWWAVLRLALASDAGVLEGAVAAGGWGLSLLPVHCVAKGRAAGALAAGRWRAAWRGTAMPAAPSAVTTASPLRRSDGGSGPS